MQEDLKKSVSERLSIFIEAKFSSVAEAARKLQIPENTLRYSYLGGKSLPGFEALLQLHYNGCNINWLLTGYKNFLELDNEGFRVRIQNRIDVLKLKFDIADSELMSEKMERDSKYYLEKSDRMEARFIIKLWQEARSLNSILFLDLATLTETSIQWLLTGSDAPEDKFREGLFLNYPEIELVVKLKNHPKIFQKVKAYIDSKLSADEIDSVEIKD